LRLILIDACRDNTFPAAKTARAGIRSVSNRGLARIEPRSPDSIIAYATKAGTTADDGCGDHSPFTTALLHNLGIPGLDIRIALGKVVDEVRKITNNRPEPCWYGSLAGDTFSLVLPFQTAVAPSQPTTAARKTEPQECVRADCDLALDLGTQEAWKAFLNTCRDEKSLYVVGAKAKLAKLEEAAHEDARRKGGRAGRPGGCPVQGGRAGRPGRCPP
jgi:hypothetical protein